MRIPRVDYSNNNTPILYDREIEEFADAVLEDYRPQLLREPGAVRFEHFLEYYLGVTLLFKDIYSDDKTRPVFGATVFRDGLLKARNRENESVANMIVRENTVIIDNYVLEPGREGLALFTGLHEGGHFLMHQGVYKTNYKNQTSPPDAKVSGVVFCRRDAIENFGSSNSSKRTARQWREHQADYFASSLAMPNATFIPFVNEFLREHGIYRRCIILGEDADLDILAKELLPERVAETYGVSKRAALIKLIKNGFAAYA